ncbi:MAG: alpha/beta hydrolase-fold protein [Chloroflexota bacterium]
MTINRRYEKIYSPAIGREMSVLAFGHYGSPVIAFPSGGGQFYDFENNDMIAVLLPLIEQGKIKVYCPAGLDHETWLNQEADPHWQAVRYNDYQDFIINNLVPTIRFDCRTPDIRIGLTGCSLGAYQAANFSLKFPHIFDYALCMSGRYDLEAIIGRASDSTEIYFNNPIAYIHHLHGDGLSHVQHNTHLTLVCGQGAWEDKCLHDTHRLADLLGEKQISHERDIWGQDVEHHWHWWRKQIAHHFNRRYGHH